MCSLNTCLQTRQDNAMHLCTKYLLFPMLDFFIAKHGQKVWFASYPTFMGHRHFQETVEAIQATPHA